MSDLTIYRGRSWKRRLTVTRQDTGAVVDLTGATIELTVKKHTGDPDPPVATRSVGSGITILTQSGATLGQADIEFSSVESAAIVGDAGLYVGDVMVELSGETFEHEAVPPVKIPIRDAL